MDKIAISVRADADQDDCLAAAEQEYISEHPELSGYDLDPRWGDGDRETVVLAVPAWAVEMGKGPFKLEARNANRDSTSEWSEDFVGRGHRFDSIDEAKKTIAGIRAVDSTFDEDGWELRVVEASAW